MSLLDIGLRNLPNVYVDKVFLNKRGATIPKMTVSLVLKDAIINRKPYWSSNRAVLNDSVIVVVVEDKQGFTYAMEKYPLNMCLENRSIETEGFNNTVHVFTIEKTIDKRVDYFSDQSLVVKTYVEKPDPDGSVYRSSILREVVQNSDGTIPQESFYFTLPSGELYSGPFHYHSPTDTFMLGERHLEQDHPRLTINYTKNKSVFSDSLVNTLSFTNVDTKTYDYNARDLVFNYTTKNNDRSIGNLFIVDLYKSLLKIDEVSQKLYELNRSLFTSVVKQLKVLEMKISRLELENEFYDNELYTPVLKATEKGIEKNLIGIGNTSVSKHSNEDCEVELYFDDDVMYALLIDKEIINQKDGRYKYVTDIKLNPVVLEYVEERITRLYRLISYYEVFLSNLDNKSLYDHAYHKLKDSYIRDIFSEYTNFIPNEGGILTMTQTPEFHTHIDTIIDAMSLLQPISSTEQEEIETELNQLINPINTNKRRLSSFIKTCRDLVYQLQNTYKLSRETKNKTNLNNSSRMIVSFQDTQSFEYANSKNSFNIFKNLKRPVISPSFLKRRFSDEKSRYFQKSLGDTSFDTLPSPVRSAFVSDKKSRFKYLTPITLHTSKKSIDLQNFDIFDELAESVFATPNISIEKKIKSNLTLLDKNNFYLDASKILGEASDFIINKIKIRKNVFGAVDPKVLNYTFSLNSIVDADDDKFNLSKQENLLLSYTKNIEENEVANVVSELPFQTKSLFYPENLRNPLNRVKATNNFKVKRLIKSVAFTTYKVEYLSGYKNGRDGLRSIHQPTWRDMENPDSLVATTSKYYLLKMTANDRFGFRNSREFIDNQNFVLMKNNKFVEAPIPIRRKFEYTYSIEEFSVSAYSTLNVLDNDIMLTSKITSRNTGTAEWSQERYNLFTSVQNSSTPSDRSRRSRRRTGSQPQRRSGVSTEPSQPSPSPMTMTRTPSPSRGGGGY